MTKSKFKFFPRSLTDKPKTKKEEKSREALLPPFLQAIKEEVAKLEKLKASGTKFTPDYNILLDVANEDDIIGMFKWICENAAELKDLSPTNQKVFFAKRKHRTGDHPYPINIHVTMPVAGRVYIEFDHNSQLPRDSGSETQKKRPEPESGEYPWKYIAEGSQKKLRRACVFDCTDRTIKPSAASVVTGERNVALMRRARDLYQPDNPYLMQTRFGCEYISHEGGQLKAIAFAPLASGSWFDMINEPELYSYSLADIPWMLYAAASGLEKFHNFNVDPDEELKRVHRDIKPENYLILRSPYGPSLYLNDFDLGLFLKEAKSAREAFSPAYVAFDRPFFNELIGLHNIVLKEIKLFKNVEDEQYKKLDIETKTRFDKYTEFAITQAEPAGYDPDVAYMQWRLTRAVQPLLKTDDGFMVGFSFICHEKNPIKINTELNHPKDDVWALCLSAKLFLDSFCELQKEYKDNKPQIIADFQKLMENNLRAQRDTRATASELLNDIKNIIKKLFKGPVDHLKESDRQECCDKYTKQLRYHLRWESPISESTATMYAEAKKTEKTSGQNPDRRVSFS